MASHNHHRRGPWSQAEDNLLMSLVQNQGALNWVRIAQILGCRTPKQCRERYHQNLKPTLNHEPITPEEGLQIERLVHEIGKRWAEIARRLNGRSDNAVKNWWNGSQNRRKRHDRRRPPYLTGLSGAAALYGERTEIAHHYAHYHHHHHHHHHDGESVDVPMGYAQMIPPVVPAPLSPAYHQRAYGVETPLPSPSALSPGADSVDMPPSLMSDNGSCHTTSPRASISAASPIELPPLKNLGTRSSCSDGTALPPVSAMITPAGQQQQHHQNAPMTQVFRHSSPPMQASHRPQEYHSPRAQLPTAPQSPVGVIPAQQRGRCFAEENSAEKDSRMNVAALLG